MAHDPDTLANGGRDAAPATPYQPNAVLRWLYRRFFSHIHVDERWSRVVRKASNKGVVVYIMRSLSFLDFLCLDWLVKRFALPVVRFVNDLGLWILEPFGKGGRRLRLRRQIPEDQALASTVRESHSALLFLRKPPRLGRASRKGERMEKDLVEVLVREQRASELPILLVPQTFVWTKRPARPKPGLLDLFFGPREWPGRLRVLVQFLSNYRNALLRSGEPFDLQQFLSEHRQLSDEEAANKVRYALLRRIERERTLVLGPTKKTTGRLLDELIRGPRLRRHIEAAARAANKSVESVERQARRDLRKLAATQEPSAVAWMYRFLDWVWNRIYDGIEIDQGGIERVREAGRQGTLVFLPSHKSHIDYLVLSYVLYKHAMSPPHIAAGDNLNFWPVGLILRRGGGFFIRRSFRGNRLYSALVDAYIRKLLVEGFPLEFFLEGGRSRTGKLLPPKFGLLSMVVDAALTMRTRETYFIPVSVGYERIIEERSYVREMGGGEKERENFGELLKSSRLLRSRYGRLYVQFGEILSLKQILAADAPQAADETGVELRNLSPNARRGLIQRLAHRIVYEIDRVTVVTPAALLASALLAHPRRGATREELQKASQMLLASLAHQNARIASTIVDEEDQIRADTLEEAIRLFLDARLLEEHQAAGAAVLSVPEERRIAVEYYRNNIIHFFVPSALIASCILAEPDSSISWHALRERVEKLSRLFKYEFMYRADAKFDTILDETLEHMLQVGELEAMADHLRPASSEAKGHLQAYAEMLRTYFESYRLAVQSLDTLFGAPLSQREWIRKTLARGQREYLSGQVSLRESLSRPKLENALTAFRDHHLVRVDNEGRLSLGSAVTSVHDLDELADKLKIFLAPSVR